ncbi:MAG TPA: TPM domain-containing protein, partial [Candidatus Ruania gallistercoris]|nr:TPM domain-containing protein [Candidatus Ruania gallistercoris]
MTRLLPRALAALTTALLSLTLIALPATAEPPSALDAHVVDNSSEQVLSGQEGEVESAIDELRSDTDLDLWVVYVDSFDGTQHAEWARQAAEATGLGNLDLLWAVAVEDRQTGFWGSEASGLSQSDLDSADSQAQDALAGDDWVGGGVTFANEVHAAATGSGGALMPVLVIGALIVVVVLVLVWVRSRRKQAAHTTGGQSQRQAAPQQPAPPQDPLAAKLAGMPLEDLRTRAGSALVTLDDSVRSSEQELAFAEAQFGLQATQEFRRALETASNRLSDAFELQAKLEDSTPETEAEQREMLTQIVLSCAKADALLDEQAESFAHLRNLRERAPQALDEIEQRAAEIEATIPPAELALTQLHATYPASALESVARAPEQARSLLAAAREAVTAGRAELTDGDRAGAVAYARTAEGALQQGVTLIESVHQGGAELADARQKLDPAIASIRSDLIDADKLAADDSGVQALIPRAQTAIAQATGAKESGDPIAALAEITGAEDALDDALAPHREQVEADQRAQRKLGTGIQRTRAFIRSTNDFIATNRGAVGPEARTRL